MKNLKPFDLQKALAGDPVVTRDGRKVLQIAHFPNAKNSVIVLLAGWDHCSAYEDTGKSIYAPTNDLFMAPKIVTKYINLYEKDTSGYYDSKEDAEHVAGYARDYIKTISVEFEE